MADILFVADPHSALNPEGDSSLAIAEGALERGHRVFWTVPSGIYLEGAQAYTLPSAMLLALKNRIPQWSTVGLENRLVADFEHVFVRKDPPFDENYCTLCWMLATTFSPRGPRRCHNAPHALLRLHEKTAHFAAVHDGSLSSSEVIPVLVSRDPKRVAHILGQWAKEDVCNGFIIKPWLGYGGRSVHFAQTPERAFEIWCAENQNALQILQPFDSAVMQTGDIRILAARGEILGAFARLPQKGSVAANLAQGGTAQAVKLSPLQLDIAKRLAAFLENEDIGFAGFDMIGNRINEVNVTSPTGLRALERMGMDEICVRTFDLITRPA